MQPGIYEVTEKSVPDGYLLDTEAKLVTLEPNRTSTVRFKNYSKPSLTINKVDAITKDGIEGAKFRVRYLSGTSGTGGTVIGEYTTSANGTIVLNRLKAGTYVLSAGETNGRKARHYRKTES